MSMARVFATLLLTVPAATGLVPQMTPPGAAANPAFEELKSLAGSWEGKKSHEVPVKLTYEVVSNGSVVMERMQPAGEAEMITMYSLEHGRLQVTHFCSAGNQPTLETEPLTAATGEYQFHFVRLAGSASPDEPHMTGLRLSLTDKTHLTQIWTFDNHGQASSETFSYTRRS